MHVLQEMSEIYHTAHVFYVYIFSALYDFQLFDNEVNVKAWLCSVAHQESSTAALRRSPSACSPRTRMMILIGQGTVLLPGIQSIHPTLGPAVIAVVPSRVRTCSTVHQNLPNNDCPNSEGTRANVKVME